MTRVLKLGATAPGSTDILILLSKTSGILLPIFTTEPVMTSDDREDSRGWEVAPIGRGEFGSCACDTAYLARTRENPGVVAGQ